MDPIDKHAQAASRDLAQKIDRAILMMILRGQFFRDGWRLAVIEPPTNLDRPVFSQEFTLLPVKPGGAPPARASYLIGG